MHCCRKDNVIRKFSIYLVSRNVPFKLKITSKFPIKQSIVICLLDQFIYVRIFRIICRKFFICHCDIKVWLSKLLLCCRHVRDFNIRINLWFDRTVVRSDQCYFRKVDHFRICCRDVFFCLHCNCSKHVTSGIKFFVSTVCKCKVYICSVIILFISRQIFHLSKKRWYFTRNILHFAIIIINYLSECIKSCYILRVNVDCKRLAFLNAVAACKKHSFSRNTIRLLRSAI